MLPSSTDDKVRSLADAVASGRSAASWAKQHNIQAEVAENWCSLPEFTGLVDARRLQVTDRMSGKLMTQSAVAIDELLETLSLSSSDSFKLSAGRVLVNDWLRVSLRFEQSRKMAELKARVAVLEKKRDAQFPNDKVSRQP
jgi:hypothetical protein